MPPEIAELKRYRFWYKDEQNQPRRMELESPAPIKMEFMRIVDDIANDISDQIGAQRAKIPFLPLTLKSTVFLAAVTDDLESERQQVRRYLEQQQIRVLPQNPYLEGSAFKEMLNSTLKDCRIFVQLLGPYLGRRPPEIPEGYLKLQLEKGQQSGLPILQWRDPKLDITTIVSEEQRGLLNSPSVIAESLESFKHRILQQALVPSNPEVNRPENSAPVVFIHHEWRDHDLARTIHRLIDDNMVAVLPVLDGSAEAIGEDLEEKLIMCNALVVVYGNVNLSWVDKQILFCNRIKPKRDRELIVIAVYDGPPEQKPNFTTKMKRLVVLNCRQQHSPEKLRLLLEPLRKREIT